MKFGPLPTSQALGSVLAHSLRLRSAQTHKAYRIAKGTHLEAQHIADLKASAFEEVIVAQIHAEDVEENEAALRLAKALAPNPAALGLRLSGAGAGRVNLYACEAGILEIDVKAILALNSIDSMITIATVPRYHRCDPGSMVATIKIIAYAVPEAALIKAEQIAQGAIHLLRPQYQSATLIETQVGEEIPSPKGREAMRARLARLGLALTPRQIVPHRENAIKTALQEASGEVVFLLTASATSDPRDVGPEALRKAGGEVTRFGLPVDPGNLLFFGSLGQKPVIGLPGCARSIALNGADWVLERLMCGVSLTQDDIAAMGVGGLLKEIPTRPQPRAGLAKNP